MKKVIVTGANGFVGSSLVKKLLVEGVEVISIDLPNCSNNIPSESRFVASDFSDLNKLFDDISCNAKDIDAFYHFAWRGVNGPDKSNPYVQLNNIKIMLDAASLAKKLNCKKFLCAGTVAEHSIKSLPFLEKSNPGIMYGTFKHSANIILESYCKSIDLNFVWMQFSNIYGPSNKTGNILSYTINQINDNQPALFGPAETMYDFIFIDDLVEAIFLIGTINNKKNFYLVGSGSPRLLKDYLLELGSLLNKQNLIKIGAREGDGVVYTADMFDCSDLTGEIGNFVSTPFSKGVLTLVN